MSKFLDISQKFKYCLIGILACIDLLNAQTVVASEGNNKLYDLSLHELLQVSISVGSFKPIDEREAFSGIDSISEGEWRHFGVTSSLEALKYLPGIDVHDSLGGSKTLSIRGYTGSTASARGKALLYDGIPLNGYSFATSMYSKSLLPLDLFGNIEFAKGPISSFYGPDAFHGALLFLPWEQNEPVSELSLRSGTLDNQELSFRSVYDFTPNFKSTSNINIYRQDNAEIQNENFSSNISAKYDSASMSQIFDIKGQRLGLLYSETETDDHYDIFRADSGSKIANSKSILLYYRGNIEQRSNIKFKPSIWYNISELDFRFFNYSRAEAWKDIQFGTKLIANYQADAHDINFGIEYTNSESADSYSYDLTGPKLKSLYAGAVKEVSSLLFQYQYALPAKSLKFDAGLRYDYFSNTEQAELSPKLGLIWASSEEHTIKLLASQGYRAPAAGEIAGTSAFLGNDTLEGETLTNFELIHFFSNKYWKVTTSIFENRWQNAIITQSTTASLNVGKNGEFVNAGKNKSKGIEGKIRFVHQPSNIKSFFHWSYVHSENTMTGKEYNLFPEWKVAYGLSYQSSKSTWSLAQLHKINRKSSGLVGAEQLPDFSELTAHVAYQFKHARISASIINLLDKENREPSIWDIEGGIRNAGRISKISLTFNI